MRNKFPPPYRLKAFTLSEVLITLVIIGIVAAITVPTLFSYYQEQALKSSLEKNYSALKQALDRYQIDNGERLVTADLTERRQLKGILMSEMNVMHDCSWGANDSKACIQHYFSDDEATNDEKTSKNYKTLNGEKNIDLSYFNDGQFVLTDGSLVLLEDWMNTRIFVSVDVNGFGKKPNRLGKDLFMFQLMPNGELLPMGAKGTRFYSATDQFCSNSSDSDMNGAGCTYKKLK